MSLYPPHPDGELPLVYTWACEGCRPRVVHRYEHESDRDGEADAHLTNHEFGQVSTITRSTMRARDL